MTSPLKWGTTATFITGTPSAHVDSYSVIKLPSPEPVPPARLYITSIPEIEFIYSK